MNNKDIFINWLNGFTYAGSGVTLGSLLADKEELSFLFSCAVFLFTAVTFCISSYIQLKRNRREALEENRKALIFEQEQQDRRIGELADTGDRRRCDDNK